MNSFWQIFCLEWRSIVRSKMLALLLIASVGWMLATPWIFRTDGSEAGARELLVHYSLGGVALLLAVSLLASAAGSLSRERATRRLALTLVRPVWRSVVVLGRIAAYACVGALVLGFAVAIEACRSDCSRPCDHVLAPTLPDARSEAEKLCDAYLKDPQLPPEVRALGRSRIVSILLPSVLEHYDKVQTNAVHSWSFTKVAEWGDGRKAVRLRFSTLFGLRQDVRGQFYLNGLYGAVNQVSESMALVELTADAAVAPLWAAKAATGSLAPDTLYFANTGEGAVMLRPRRDLDLLIAADGFGWNLLRAAVVLWGLFIFLVSLGLFLGAALGRPSALFAALAILLLSELCPSVADGYSEDVTTSLGDRIGLSITRVAADLTRPISARRPLEALARDERIEWEEVLHTLAVDCFLVPLVVALLCAVILPRKQESLLGA